MTKPLPRGAARQKFSTLAVDPGHNSLEDYPYKAQNRVAEEQVLQHARILLDVLSCRFTGGTVAWRIAQGPAEVAAHRAFFPLLDLCQRCLSGSRSGPRS